MSGSYDVTNTYNRTSNLNSGKKEKTDFKFLFNSAKMSLKYIAVFAATYHLSIAGCLYSETPRCFHPLKSDLAVDERTEHIQI